MKSTAWILGAVRASPREIDRRVIHHTTPLGDTLPLSSSRLRVNAKHGYGAVDIDVELHESHIIFSLAKLSTWSVPPSQRHLRFGLFWSGILTNATSPVIMGKIQGPMGVNKSLGPGGSYAGGGQAARMRRGL